MSGVKDLLVILLSSSLVSNVVLSQFLGLCPFLGVSKKTNTAAGMGVAVIFVITLASAVAGLMYKFILVPLNIEYLQTTEDGTLLPLGAHTPKEIQAIAQRFAVAEMLNEKKVYTEIVEKTGASTATISRVSRSMNEGFQTAFTRLQY